MEYERRAQRMEEVVEREATEMEKGTGVGEITGATNHTPTPLGEYFPAFAAPEILICYMIDMLPTFRCLARHPCYRRLRQEYVP